MGNYQTEIIAEWIKTCGYDISSQTLNLELLSHPDFPNLNSITESLLRLGIEVVALRLDNKPLEELEGSFIAYLVRDGIPALVLVKKLRANEELITLFLGKGKHLKISRDEFLTQWNGIIVVADEQKRAIHNRLRFIKPFVPSLLLAGIFITCFFAENTSFWVSLHFLLSFVGLTVCLVIVAHELGFSVASRFCNEGKYTSCNAVLSSRAAKLPFGIGLSDVGITYFSCLLIYWVTASLGGSLVAAAYGATIVALLSIPFTLFSVAYQGLVVKKFCPLCLSVVAVLWLQAIALIPFMNNLSADVSLWSVFLMVGIGLLVFLGWIMLKPLLRLPNQNREVILENLIFRRNYQLFLLWFNQAPSIEDNNVKDICIGNSNALLRLTLITNPFCSPCADLHRIAEDLIQRFPGYVSVSIRFYVPFDNRNKSLISERLLELAKDEVPKALHHWFECKKIDSWVKTWGMPSGDLSNEILREHKRWCHKHGIFQTPTILINGKMLPYAYRSTDIEWFAGVLIKQLELEYARIERVVVN